MYSLKNQNQPQPLSPSPERAVDETGLIGCPNSDPGIGAPDNSTANPKQFLPTRYQSELFEFAMKRNTIAVLEAGAGSTMVAVMLIKEIGQAIKSNDHKKLILFLAPTVCLVNEQFEVIKKHSSLKAGEYYGAKGVDAWNLETWEKEINEHDVLVMTPQILLDALRNAFLSLETACFIIIDECHRAAGNHPYAKVMKEFYHKSSKKPKVFGMTESPVTRKDCEDQYSELESILDAQVYTVEDRTEFEEYFSSATGIYRFYDQACASVLSLKLKIEALLPKFDALFLELHESVRSNYKDMSGKLKALQKRMSNDQQQILFCLEDLGLICAYEAVNTCLEDTADRIEADCEISRRISAHFKSFLEEVMHTIVECLPLGKECGSNLRISQEVIHPADKIMLENDCDYMRAMDLGYLSPKFLKLLQIFQSFGKDREMTYLIFFERIVTAKVIERFLKKVPIFPHYLVSYFAGSKTLVDASTPMSQGTLDLFHSGKVNLLFAIDAVEVGIKVPNYSYVIYFDLPKTTHSYIKSHSQAQETNSQFVIMMERGNMKQRNQLFDMIKSDSAMVNTGLNGDLNSLNCSKEKSDVFLVDSTGASVSEKNSISLIQQYCSKLPGQKHLSSKPNFQVSCNGKLYQCQLTLPPNAAFQTIAGPASRSSHLSKQLVCLEACKKLHRLGALNDHLLPSLVKPLKSDCILNSKESASGAGTTKRKELHGTTSIHALSGNWEDNTDGANFYAYRFDFSCNDTSDHYCGFVLLIDSKLDDDVANIEIDLYSRSKIVKAVASSFGKILLNAEEMVKARCFQEFFFNGLFGRLLTGSILRELVIQNEAKSLWSPSKMYLLLPLEVLDHPSEPCWKINWTIINSCVTAVEFLKKRCLPVECENDKKTLSLCNAGSLEAKYEGTNMIQLANSLVDGNNLKDMVVLAIHTGKIYCVSEVVSYTSAESTFDGKNGKSSTRYKTFSEYFSKKYGIGLRYPAQPLLQLKQSHNPHNLLVNFNIQGNQQAHVHMPPELLFILDARRDVLRSFYLLPSLMHRLESLMLASQLREEIHGQTSNFSIPCSLILEALTTTRCCEMFSMERLELLGDSVLKFAVSCHLFLKYPKKHEGQLSSQRSWAVCNSTLHKLATDRKLQGYIRDSAFEPRLWLAPGQHPMRCVPCNCGVDTLEVPLDARYQTEDPKINVGDKSCDRGHRWLSSKTIADCAEALIGAYYVGGGLISALHVMKWLGVDAEPSLVADAITAASLHSLLPKSNDLATLETKIGYQFTFQGLLLEAITHSSQQETGIYYSYERLEFLGDSVLDLLITRHLYHSYEDIDPGELTDLRSASVNNEYFARAAVRKNLHEHLLHSSEVLQSQISEYARFISESSNSTRPVQGIKAPKALGDLVESIAGAILIDAKLDLEEVWGILKPLLSPIVTPDELELPPLRQLIELCDSLGYFLKENCRNTGELVHAEICMQLKDKLLIGEGYEQNIKNAKEQAASHLLCKLKERGISYSNSISKKRKHNCIDINDSPSVITDISTCSDMIDDYFSEPMKKITKINLPGALITATSPSKDCFNNIRNSNLEIPVIASINTEKGGPRATIFELCKKLQWPMPTFNSTEHKSRTPMEFGEGSGRRTGFNSYVSSINLYIPNQGHIECKGNPRADKKSSLDSAVLEMLHELERRERIIIGCPNH